MHSEGVDYFAFAACFVYMAKAVCSLWCFVISCWNCRRAVILELGLVSYGAVIEYIV